MYEQKSPSQFYIAMLACDLSAFRDVTEPQEMIDALEVSWATARDQFKGRAWPDESRAAYMVWAAIGLMAFGRLDHVVEAIGIVKQFPNAVNLRPCRLYKLGFEKLLPLPVGLDPYSNPEGFLAWFRGTELEWDAEGGLFRISSKQSRE